MLHFDDTNPPSDIWPPSPDGDEECVDDEEDASPFLTRSLWPDLILGFVFGMITTIIPIGLLFLLASSVWHEHGLNEKIQYICIFGLVISVQIGMFVRWWRRYPHFCLVVLLAAFLIAFVMGGFLFG